MQLGRIPAQLHDLFAQYRHDTNATAAPLDAVSVDQLAQTYLTAWRSLPSPAADLEKLASR